MQNENPARTGARVLVVDDEKPLRLLLKVMLEPIGYKVGLASSGSECLKTVREFSPQLILLDIMMPEPDGIETCRRLKADPATADIPVIFLTAMTDSQSKLKAFGAGAVDYISKPFHKEEMLMRIQTQFNLHFQQRHLAEYAARLQEMVEERTRLLVHADRMATIGAMASKFVHEMSSPVLGITANADFALDAWEAMREYVLTIAEANPDGRIARAAPMMDKALANIRYGAKTAKSMFGDLQRYAAGGGERRRETRSLEEIIDDARRIMGPRMKSVEFRLAGLTTQPFTCDPQKMQQVFVNLFSNSLDALPDEGGAIEITAGRVGGKIQVVYRDNGHGIPVDIREKIFEPFFTTKAPARGTGLGMMIVQEILRDHGGRIRLAPDEGHGTRFELILDPDGDGRPQPEIGFLKGLAHEKTIAQNAGAAV